MIVCSATPTRLPPPRLVADGRGLSKKKQGDVRVFYWANVTDALRDRGYSAGRRDVSPGCNMRATLGELWKQPLRTWRADVEASCCGSDRSTRGCDMRGRGLRPDGRASRRRE